MALRFTLTTIVKLEITPRDLLKKSQRLGSIDIPALPYDGKSMTNDVKKADCVNRHFLLIFACENPKSVQTLECHFPDSLYLTLS